jgi:hypothetical protein
MPAVYGQKTRVFLHYFTTVRFAFFHTNEPRKWGGRQERRIGSLNEAGRTGGRSKAKDCANGGIVIRRRPCEPAQLRPAAAGREGSDRPPREWCSFCRFLSEIPKLLVRPANSQAMVDPLTLHVRFLPLTSSKLGRHGTSVNSLLFSNTAYLPEASVMGRV